MLLLFHLGKRTSPSGYFLEGNGLAALTLGPRKPVICSFHPEKREVTGPWKSSHENIVEIVAED